MNHEVLKNIIFDQHRVIQNAEIVERNYELEDKMNYVLVGLRRSGKSTMLYKRALELVNNGMDWEQIIYINFEDERLSEFSLEDFNDIVQTAGELSDKEPVYFFDEIQNIVGWEKFARRMADSGALVYITGSNAKMLSQEMALALGGRYFPLEIMTYSFTEYLTAQGMAYDEKSLLTAVLNGKIRAAAINYMTDGAFPETTLFKNKKPYVANVYDKVLLGDIAARNSIRNIQSLRVMMKKIAESVTSEITYSKLQNAVSSVGFKVSKDSVISYVAFAEQAYLLFRTTNYIAKFSEKESTPRFYFYDNGLLNLFLVDKKSLLLENVVATALKRKYGEELYYFKSSKTGIDIDFYVPDEGLAIQVTYTLNENDYHREVKSLVSISKDNALKPKRYIIITLEDDERVIEENGIKIECIPLYKFLITLN